VAGRVGVSALGDLSRLEGRHLGQHPSRRLDQRYRQRGARALAETELRVEELRDLSRTSPAAVAAELGVPGHEVGCSELLDVKRTPEWGVACRRPTSIRRFSCPTVMLV